MSIKKIKALTFDTGGTILDWHSGFLETLRSLGEKYNYHKDWGTITNEIRRRSLKAMLNLGENKPPKYNFDINHFIAEGEHVCKSTILSLLLYCGVENTQPEFFFLVKKKLDKKYNGQESITR